MDRFFQLIRQTPFSDEVQENFNPSNERIKDADYCVDLRIARLKRCL